jgi:hypothetical protein
MLCLKARLVTGIQAAKDPRSVRIFTLAPWLGCTSVQAELVRIWRDEATAWRVGYYLLMP